VKQIRHALLADDLVAWAVGRLVAGEDTPAITLLAGLDLAQAPLLDDALALFRQAMTELDLDTAVTKSDLLRHHLREIAREVLKDEPNIPSLVERIEREVVSPSGRGPCRLPRCLADVAMLNLAR
jgi:hypothetical protein